MRRALYILLTVLAGLLLSATVVYAAGPRYIAEPPETAVYKGQTLLQKAHHRGYSWNVWSEKTHRWYHRAYVKPPEEITFPVADKVGAQAILAQRYYWEFPPTHVVMRSYNRADMSDKPVYLKPGWAAVRGDDGKILYWEILTRLEKPHTQHYIKTTVTWERRGSTHYSYGWASYLTHFKTY
jgi:hypothetical protein